MKISVEEYMELKPMIYCNDCQKACDRREFTMACDEGIRKENNNE